MRFCPVVLFAVLSLALTACHQESEPVSPDLPPTPILTSESSWGVTRSTYSRIRRSAGSEAEVCGVLRLGDVVEIRSRVSGRDEKNGNGQGNSGVCWLEVLSENGRG